MLILGAGLAGGNAAVALRENGHRGRIVLVGREPAPPYGRPPLSKTYLRGEGSLDGWTVRPAEWYAANDVELRTGVSAVHVDTAQRRLQLSDGTSLDYDALAVCSGGRARRPRLPGVDLDGVHVLRTVEDADAIRAAARPGRHAVVVGMGFIGAEVAASLRQMGVEVTAVFPGGAPLTTALGPEVGAVLAGIHADNGVQLLAGDSVVAFEGDGAVERVVTRSGARIACDLVVVGAGIDPDVEAVAGTPVSVDNGILVDAQCRTGVAGVYAAGDVANHLHPLFGRVRVEHYNNAEKMGHAVARSMLGDGSPYGYVHTFWSDQYEHSLEYAGHVREWETLVVRGSLEERRFLGVYVAGGTVRAAVGLNRGGDPELDEDSEMHACQLLVARRAQVRTEWLADEGVDLRELAAAR
ncbi:MAG TPA: FAD-dependent oxidoreductase [Candidatus Dormibacteraeota bacterium]|nr:FAD-dependent oxidoreductase [Candidatus Dormibacteraeota bacterium]